MFKILMKHIQLIRYFFIGISAAALDVSIFVLLKDQFETTYYLATTISIAVATIYAFSLNAFLNFKVTDKLFRRLAMYSVTSLVGWVLSIVFLFIFATQLGFGGTQVKILSLPIVFVVQYLCNKRFTFNDSPLNEDMSVVDVVSDQDALGESQKHHVAVIGGGFTGLAAAYELVKQGKQVTIFEFRDHLGGLASGFDLNGFSMERAYHFVYQTDEDTLALADELGIRDQINFYPSSIKYFYKGEHYDFMTPMDLLRFTPITFISRVRLGMFALYLKMVRNWRPLSEVTAMEWLTKHMGAEATEEVWTPLLKGKFNHYYDKITMSWLWGRFSIRARSQDKDLGGEKLGYPVGGFNLIVEAMQKKIEDQGGEIRYNTGVQSIKHDEEAGCTKITTLDGETYDFDGIIATVPSPIFADMIEGNVSVSTEYTQKLKSVEYLDAVVMVMRTPQRLTDTFWYNINDENVKFLTLLSISALAGTAQFGGSEVYYVGAYVPREHHYMTEDYDVVSEWKKSIQVMFPEFDENQIQGLELFKFKDAQHIVDIGYEENKLVPFASEVPGVYLANFSQIYPDDRGTNFAVRDGREVARELINFLTYGK